MNDKKQFAKVFLIAGSEPLGSAGMQADIKAVSACGGYAACAVTCIVDEDTTHVKSIHTIPVDMIRAQAESFLGDVGADCIKTGMLYSTELILTVEEILKEFPGMPRVIDPVMVNSIGQPLLKPDAVAAYKERLFPLADIITPNFREAAILLGHPMQFDTLRSDLKFLTQWGNAVIVKSFPSEEGLTDYFYDPKTGITRWFNKRKIETKNVNGTGDSFASAIAAYLAQKFTMLGSVESAEEFIINAIESGSKYAFGTGYGPVNPFYMLKPKPRCGLKKNSCETE